MSASANPLLDIRNLRVRFPGPAGPVPVVDGVSFEIRPGQHFGLVGESGSGKSVTALSLLGLINPPGTVEADHIVLAGTTLRPGDHAAFQRVRGRDVALVMQDPLTSLSPVFSVGQQIIETIRHHRQLRPRLAREEAVELLAAVGISDPRARVDDYPHQLSGGMRQRVAIALALACQPALLIADEPTTALDVTIRAQVIELLLRLSDERDMAVLLITHDFGMLAGFAEVVGVMYAGRIVEQGPVNATYATPAHPYTAALLASQPRPRRPRLGRLNPIPGQPPDPAARPPGCPFHPRCAIGSNRLRCAQETPALRPVGPAGQLAACHYAEELVGRATGPAEPEPRR